MSGKEEEREESTAGPSAAKHRRKTATINVNHELHARWLSMKKAHGFRNDSDLMKYLLDTFEKGIAESPTKSSTPAKPSSARSLFMAPVTPIARAAASTSVQDDLSDINITCAGRLHDSDIELEPADRTVHITMDGTDVEVEADSGGDDWIEPNQTIHEDIEYEDVNDAVATMELSLIDEAVPLQDDSAPEPTINIERDISADVRVIEDDCSRSKRLLDDGYEMDFLKSQGMCKSSAELKLSSEQRIVVEKASLVELLGKRCRHHDCQELVTVHEHFVGSVLILKWTCAAGHIGQWQSSAPYCNTYAMNIILPAAIFITGNNFSKVSLLFKALGLASVSASTFYRVQNLCVLPGVTLWHDMMQASMFQHLNDDRNIPVVLAGDGRNDSPGHSAQYCSYTFMLDHLHYVLHTELIDKRMTRLRSPNMELEGLVRGLDFLKGKLKLGARNEMGELQRAELITDAHPQVICKLAGPSYTSWLLHQMDIWHKANKIGSKVLEAAKRKENDALHEWVSAVRNHFWHCAESCGGDEETLRRMWHSLLFHVQGVHQWYGGSCSHGPIDDHERTPLHPESPAVDALRAIVKDQRLNNSLRFYTNFRHTGRLENFHQVVLVYCPKRISFQYKVMEGRMRMAMFDQNHHIHRAPKLKQDGTVQYRRQFSNKGRRWVAVTVKEAKDYSYLQPLLAIIMQQRLVNPTWMTCQVPIHQNDPANIAPTIAPVLPPDTSSIVALQKSRFGHTGHVAQH